jgi:hypothetical protein
MIAGSVSNKFIKKGIFMELQEKLIGKIAISDSIENCVDEKWAVKIMKSLSK